MKLYVELPDNGGLCRWAGPAMCEIEDENTISSSTPIALPADKAKALVEKLRQQGRRAVLYRKRGAKLHMYFDSKGGE